MVSNVDDAARIFIQTAPIHEAFGLITTLLRENLVVARGFGKMAAHTCPECDELLSSLQERLDIIERSIIWDLMIDVLLPRIEASAANQPQ